MDLAPRRRVLLLIDSLLSGGAQRQIVVLANELSRRGHRVELLAYYPHDQLSGFLSSPPVRYQVVHRRGRFDWSFPFRLYRHLRRSAPDCIISYLTTPNFLARTIGRLAGVPRVITSHRDLDLSRRPAAALLERLLAPASSKIVVNAREIRREMMELGIDGERIEVIYNGVDLAQFARRPEAERRAAREALGVAPGELLLLLPGRMEQKKNHLLLVEAVEHLDPSLRARVRVAFAGNELSAEIKERLLEALRANGLGDRFRFLGQRSDMALLYSAADVVVLPSLWEGFPNVVVEAMACEAPVVVSDVSDNRTLVEHGVSGFVFAPGSRPALVAALEAVLRTSPEERRAMGRRGAARVRALCSLETFGDRYEALIEGRPLPAELELGAPAAR
jgi:glycosyltransferase involved in cell wall biosynthesis